MRTLIIGGGISGIAAARVLMRFGHRVTVLERGPRPGGVWAVAYPEVRLQNTRDQYRLAGFPWPTEPELHPSREQILEYLQAAVRRFDIDLRLSHQVVRALPHADGWRLQVAAPDGPREEDADFVLVASGQYTGAPQPPVLADRERFRGQVVTDRQVLDLDVLAGKTVAVVGFGKSAVDMAALAAERGSRVHHVFREPRWLLPKYMLGQHATRVMFARASTAMIPSWVHPGAAERTLHDRFPWAVEAFWTLIQALVRRTVGLHDGWRDPEVRRRMALLRPGKPITHEMRSALALAPDSYYPQVIEGRIEPHRGTPAGFSERGLLLDGGEEITCDLVVLSTGFSAPAFPFLPDQHRQHLEGEPDGPQLYRHLLHPRIPRMAFAGFNHGFFHVPGVELATIWLAAWLRGDLVLPPLAEMEGSMARVREWKRRHVLFEPSRGVAVSTRFHQYFDTLLGDLGLSPYRKIEPARRAGLRLLGQGLRCPGGRLPGGQRPQPRAAAAAGARYLMVARPHPGPGGPDHRKP